MTRAAVEGLRATHDDFLALMATLTADQWLLPSACAGWRVQDVLAHVTSNFKEMVDPTPASPGAIAPATAEEAMELLVAPRKSWTATELVAEYDRYADTAFATLTAMQDEPVASMSLDVADLGSYPMQLLANAYCFDHYCHLRHDLLAPGGPLADVLPPADDARLRPGIDWMWAGLPQMCREAMVVVDRPLTIELTGVGGGSWTLHPATDSGCITIEENGSGGAADVTSNAHDFVSWGTGRSAWRDACSLRGDTDYATRVLDAIDII
jgi:uncharacterized protein (TIGR03083 family)